MTFHFHTEKFLEFFLALLFPDPLWKGDSPCSFPAPSGDPS